MDFNRRDMMTLAAAGAVVSATNIGGPSAMAQTAPAAQAPGFYRFRVGDMIVTAINDGFAPRPLEGFVRNVELPRVQEAAAAAFLPTDTIQNTFTSLVVQSGNRLVLLDTGLGEFGAPTTGTWMANFRAAGFDPAQVTHILVSHFHGDHIGGIRNRDGALRFPNAEISVPAPEWDFWMSDERMSAAPEAARGGFQNARRVFQPIAANVRRFAPGAEVVPGITSVAAHGHSPGHTLYLLSSGNARHLFLADITSHPGIFVTNPDWAAIFDMDPAQAVSMRRRTLDMVATDRIPVSFYHAPFPAVANIARDGNAFRYVPVQWTTGI